MSQSKTQRFEIMPGNDMTGSEVAENVSMLGRSAPARTGVASSIAEHFSCGGFGRHVFTLMSGSAVAQVLMFGLSPILTRLYKPEDFGALALYTSILFISAPLVSARYEMAIVPATDKDEAFGLLLLCCALAVAFGLASSLLALPKVLTSIGLAALQRYVWLIPFSVTVTGLFQAVRQYCIRDKEFHRLSLSQVYQSGSSVAVQIGVGAILASPWGLLLGQLTGTLISTCTIGRNIGIAWRTWHSQHTGQQIETLWTLANRHKRHPAFLPWGGLVDAVAQRLPVLVLSGFYGPYFLGLYAVADRIIRTPVSLIGQNCAPVLFQKMSEQRTKARITSVLAKWGVGMSVFFTLPAVVLYFASRYLFAVVFGKTWVEAGALSVVLIPIYWGSLVVSPVSGLLIIANRQALYSLIQAAFLVTGFGSLWLGHHWMWSAKNTVLLYSLAQFVVYLFYFATIFTAGKDTLRRQRA